MSRARWLAFGSCAVVAGGCLLNASCAESSVDADTHDAAARDGFVGATPTTRTDGGGDASLVFICGDAGECAWPSSFCAHVIQTVTVDECHGRPGGTSVRDQGWTCRSFQEPPFGCPEHPTWKCQFPSACTASLGCDCIVDSGVIPSTSTATVTNEARCDNGGLIVTENTQKHEICAGCYGSPPVRLERIAGRFS